LGVRRVAVAAVLLVALVIPALVSADPGSGPPGGVLGTVPAAAPGQLPIPQGEQGNQGGQGDQGGSSSGAPPAAGGLATGTNMSWHNGPVMHSNTTYLVFWGSMPTGYESTIIQYFKDVAADSHNSATQNTNVYSTDPQYTDATGRANYDSTYGGAYDASDPIPDHCSSQYGALASKLAGCVVDSDLQTEIGKAMTALGSGGGSTNIYFVFTPPKVGSCSGSDCAYLSYCAYHWYFPQVGSASNVIYTNQPYTDPTGISTTLTGACESGSQPNGNWADETINVASHEHNESITDPYGSGWYEGNYNEDGDKCVWNFGSPLGTTPSGAAYNQVINGHFYYLQQEWNNASTSCVERTTPPPPAPTNIAFTPGSGTPGTTVTITGQYFTGATSVKFNGASASFTVDNDGQITATVPSNAASGPITVTTASGTGSSSPSAFQVTTPPAPDFTVNVSPTSLTINRGSSAPYTVTITSVNGFTGSVRLSVSMSGGQNAPSASLSRSTITGSGTSTLTISTRGNTRSNTYSFTVTGTSGSLKHTASGSVTVK
jgi:hypothetical protein